MSSIRAPATSEIAEVWGGIEKGLEEAKAVVHFIEKRLQIEEDYAKALMKLCKNSTPTPGTHIGDAFDALVQSTSQQAAIILGASTECSTDIADALAAFIKNMKVEAKASHAEGLRLHKERGDCFDMLKKARSNYESACKEGEPDPAKLAILEEDYKKQIAFTNRYQDTYHNEKVPKVQADMIKLEMLRIQKCKTFISKLLKSYEDLFSKISATIVKPQQVADNIDAKQQVQALSVVGKRSNIPANDFVFEQVELADKSKKSWRKTISGSSALSLNSPNLGSLFSPSISSKTHSTSSSSLLSSGTAPSSSAPSASAVFGVYLEDAMDRQKTRYPQYEVPFVLPVLTGLVRQLGGFHTEGIFRVPGLAAEIQTIKHQLDEGSDNIQSTNVHTPASLLKLWLRELPEPLVPEPMYGVCIECDAADSAAEVFRQFPPLNQRVIVYVLTFLQELAQPENVVDTLMNVDNLAMVFAPSFIRCNNLSASDMMHNVQKEKAFIKALLDALDRLSVQAKGSSALSDSPWQQATTPEGKVYYYNTVTRQTSWTNPAQAESPAAPKPSFKPGLNPSTGLRSPAMVPTITHFKPLGQQHVSTPSPNSPTSTPTSPTNSVAAASPMVASASQDTWVEYTTEDGKRYYFNPTTQKTSWTRPEPALPAPLPALPPPPITPASPTVHVAFPVLPPPPATAPAPVQSSQAAHPVPPPRVGRPASTIFSPSLSMSADVPPSPTPVPPPRHVRSSSNSNLALGSAPQAPPQGAGPAPPGPGGMKKLPFIPPGAVLALKKSPNS
eukprot:TRINITY_DN12778_c0_g1_i1.p1 TRINITY_DN12778_c0_g1~~TRINITY_DN12778_c0_g1_i1.p1  ORF type:complete len:785 (-),score=141.61 TRINITY_DN12778_c0_g1_i1:31-2385(-)